MGGCYGGPQARQTLGDRGRDNRQDKHIVVLGLTRHLVGALIRAAEKRHNRSGRGERVEASLLEVLR